MYFVALVLSLLVDILGGKVCSAGWNQFDYLGCLAIILPFLEPFPCIINITNEKTHTYNICCYCFKVFICHNFGEAWVLAKGEVLVWVNWVLGIPSPYDIQVTYCMN